MTTQKQKAALKKAAPAQRAQMLAQFQRQAQTQQRKPNKPAPQRQPKAAPWPKPKPPKPAAEPLNLLDPMCPLPMPTLASDGKALPYTGMVSVDFSTSTTNTTCIFLQNTGDSGTCGYMITLSPSGDIIGSQAMTIPTLATRTDQGGPTATRAMKLSGSLVNCTNVMHRGGRVTYLNSSQRMPQRDTLATPDNFAHVVEAIKASPYRRRITGDQLKDALQLISFPIDNVAYTSFKRFRGTLSTGDICDHIFAPSEIFTEPEGTNHHDQHDQIDVRPMSTICFILDPTQTAQDYSITVRASYYTRWPLATVPGQSMRPMPTADPKLVNYYRDRTEAQAHEFQRLGKPPGLGKGYSSKHQQDVNAVGVA